jgi:hypothetical protein
MKIPNFNAGGEKKHHPAGKGTQTTVTRGIRRGDNEALRSLVNPKKEVIAAFKNKKRKGFARGAKVRK